MNLLKNPMILLLGIMFGLLACSEEPDVLENPRNPAASRLDFVQDNISLSEKAAPLTLKIDIQPAAREAGEVTLRLGGDADYGSHFSTTPAAEDGLITLAVEKGQSTLELLLTPLFRDAQEDDHLISLSIESTSGIFQKGNKFMARVNLQDEASTQEPEPPVPATISFTDSLFSVSEADAEGVEISLQIEGDVQHSGLLMLNVKPTPGRIYGTHFSTSPAVVLGQITLDIVPGMEEVSFRVYPVNDYFLKENYEIKISIASVSEGIQAGEISQLRLTVEDDDEPQVETHTIAEVRARFEQFNGNFYFPQDYFVEGIVTSGSNVSSEKVLYLQDETAGIFLNFTQEPMLKAGDKVVLNLKGGEGYYVNEQRAIRSIADITGTVVAEGQVVHPLEVRLSELDPQLHQGRLLMITDVEFPDANGQRTFDGSNRIVQDGNSAYVKTYESYAHKNMVLPSGKKTVVGILGDWDMILPQNSPYIGEWF
jgi:hypothetical protein